ncbi:MULTISPECIES: hypothetical protein [Bacillus]|uniref:Uncharacterized protein n=2 Tax=Bacillus TaxID=1386 RepID=A0A0M4FY03_9BACI|nr:MULTISPECIES: hypothetical protein [Bacillus]ALC82100.1 hypothetical protein AM592_11140 [Bacillus gobiensis]MBP1083452.1 hypothetical protein [Bacillus capparidis]MED1097884.1 hypothetical protein [Bacillus capparidis]
MNKEMLEMLLASFEQEVKDTSEPSFHKAVNSFANLWDYEFGCLNELPKEIDQWIGQTMYEYELYQD